MCDKKQKVKNSHVLTREFWINMRIEKERDVVCIIIVIKPGQTIRKL